MQKMKWLGLVISFILCFFLLSACNKEEETFLDEMIETDGGTLLFEGVFQNSSRYETSGTAQVFLEEDGSRTLVLSDFRTDPGPDLKVYLSNNTSADSFTDLGELKATSGSFSYEISQEVNLESQNQVLIWCKDFSVLFGSAELTE